MHPNYKAVYYKQFKHIWKIAKKKRDCKYLRGKDAREVHLCTKRVITPTLWRGEELQVKTTALYQRHNSIPFSSRAEEQKYHTNEKKLSHISDQRLFRLDTSDTTVSKNKKAKKTKNKLPMMQLDTEIEI